MTVHIVTEGESDTGILKALLADGVPGDLELEFFSTPPRAAAFSIARTLLASRPHRLALVVDADSNNPAPMRVRMDEVLSLVASPDRYGVFVATPDLESCLLSAGDDALAQALGLPVEEVRSVLATRDGGLRQLLERAGRGTDAATVAALAGELAPALRARSEFVASLIAFLVDGDGESDRN